MASKLSQKHLVEFFFDVVSPWSYLAFEVITRYHRAAPASFDLQLKPFFLGGVMKASGNSPPITVPLKGAHMMLDLARSAPYCGVAIRQPSTFPANTISFQRVLTSLTLDHQDIEAVARNGWKAYWHDDRDITSADVMLSILKASNVADPEKRLASISDARVKDALAATTKDAVNRGAFGAPFFFVTPKDGSEQQAYFGSDRFHLIFPSIDIPWTGPFPQPSRL